MLAFIVASALPGTSVAHTYGLLSMNLGATLGYSGLASFVYLAFKVTASKLVPATIQKDAGNRFCDVVGYANTKNFILPLAATPTGAQYA